jgi:hypothetical protein
LTNANNPGGNTAITLATVAGDIVIQVGNMVSDTDQTMTADGTGPPSVRQVVGAAALETITHKKTATGVSTTMTISQGGSTAIDSIGFVLKGS